MEKNLALLTPTTRVINEAGAMSTSNGKATTTTPPIEQKGEIAVTPLGQGSVRREKRGPPRSSENEPGPSKVRSE